MNANIDEEGRLSSNRRNGYNHTQVQTSPDKVTIHTLRDRDPDLNPSFSKNGKCLSNIHW